MYKSTFRDYVRRISLLIFGPVYLLMVSTVVSEASGRPWLMAVAWVFTGSIIVMATLTAFGVRALNNNDSELRFGLGTVFLITIPLGVYLATIRWVIQGVRPGGWRLDGIIVGVVGNRQRLDRNHPVANDHSSGNPLVGIE